MKENKTGQAKPVLDGGRCSTQHKAVGLSCCPLGCLTVLHGCSRRTQRCSLFTRGFGAYHRVVAVEKVGVGAVVFDLSLSVCVSV